MEEYRYMIWNNVQKEYQFASICEPTEKAAKMFLFGIIGNDARKWRFEIKKLKKQEALKIRHELKIKNKIRRIHQEIPNVSEEDIRKLVLKNEEVQND